MSGSYDTPRTGVLQSRAGVVCAAMVAFLVVTGPAEASPDWGRGRDDGCQQADSGVVQPATSSQPIILQLRVFNGHDDVTFDTKLQLFPRGQRTTPIPIVVGADKAYEARVPAGFYDVQAIREQEGRVAGIRWIEQLLVQRYPDEYGRHLQVINFRPDFGALQLRPAPESVAAARGWTGAIFAAGDEAREVARARPVGEDLLVVVAAGRYDVRISLADRTIHWLRDVEIPADATRLKTWPAPTP